MLSAAMMLTSEVDERWSWRAAASDSAMGRETVTTISPSSRDCGVSETATSVAWPPVTVTCSPSAPMAQI